MFSKTTSNCKFYIDILVQQVCIIRHIRYNWIFIITTSAFNIYCKPADQFKASKFDSGVESIRLQSPDWALADSQPNKGGVSWCYIGTKRPPKSSVVIFFSSMNIRLSHQHLNKSLHLMSYKNTPISSFHWGWQIKKILNTFDTDSNYTNSEWTEFDGVLRGRRWKRVAMNFSFKEHRLQKCLHFTVYNVVPC